MAAAPGGAARIGSGATEPYHRRIGARTIRSHLQRDHDLQRLSHCIPGSPTTVHAVLVRYGRVPHRGPAVHVPRTPVPPRQVWELDFADMPTAMLPNTAKRRHQGAVLDVIDTGTSFALATKVSDQCDAVWTLTTLGEMFQTIGIPPVLRFDRDPRLITSWRSDGFPSALLRFLRCLGIMPEVCPPRRPDHKPYVERFMRTQKEECTNRATTYWFFVTCDTAGEIQR